MRVICLMVLLLTVTLQSQCKILGNSRMTGSSSVAPSLQHHCKPRAVGLSAQTIEQAAQLTMTYARMSLLACTIAYGSNYMMTKSLQQKFPPSMINVFRFAIASVLFLP